MTVTNRSKKSDSVEDPRWFHKIDAMNQKSEQLEFEAQHRRGYLN